MLTYAQARMTVDALVAAADGKMKAGESALEAGDYSSARAAREEVLSLLALLVQSTNADVARLQAASRTQFTRFTGTKVQILTWGDDRQRRSTARRMSTGARRCQR